MADATDDFVRLPQYFSPWLTPPSTPADSKLEATSPFHIDGDKMDVTKDDDRNLILDWVKENTRMKTVHFESYDTISKTSSVTRSVERLKQSLDSPNATPTMRFGSVERESKNCFNSDRQHLQTFQDKQKNQYYYTAVDKNSFNNNNNSNIKSYAIGGHNQQQHQHINSATKAMTQSSSSFYHLACIAPEDLPKDRSQAAAGVRLGCHGDEEGEDDDNEDDFVLEFLEAYRKAPEVTKFQAKVYLELWKEPLRPPHSSTFLCPDDSKKFITIHDFPSPSNQFNAANINSNNTNNNNNSSNDHSNCYPFCIHQSPDDWKVQHQHSRINHHSTNRLDIASPRNFITSTPPVACRSSSSVGGCRNVTSSSTDRTTYAKTYAFDRIFMPEETMMDVYIESVTSVLKAVLSGHNGCISCYGEPDDIDDSGRGSLAGATLRWLYALLEESSHDSLSTYSIKVSAVEFLGTGDSVRDLLLDFGTMKMKAREAGEEQQSRYIRVASCKDACQVLTKALEARSASSVNVIFTVHLRQYQARVPSHGKVISLSNQLHIINISDRQKEVSLKGMNKSHPQARDGPFASLAGRDNLMQYIGSLMIGQRLPMSSLSRLHSLLQNCILPSNVQCQSCLVIRLGKVQTPMRDVQKLLNLGTKIYKRRFSKNKHLRNTGGQSFYPMNSSASETSSCASSGFSNLRKSRVRMGTQQWQRKVDPVPAHCSVAKSAHPYEVVLTNFDRSTPVPSRPNYLNLECKFVPQSGSDQHLATSRTMSPPPLPSPFKGHWKSLAGRVLQDTIMEQPEDKWETNGTPNVQEGSSNRHETWIDGPACMLSNPYANLGHKTGAHFARDDPADPTKPVFNGLGNPNQSGRPNQIRSYRTTGSSQFFHSSIRSLSRTGDSFHSTKTFQTDLSNQRHFASRIRLNPGGIRPSNSFESSERLVPNTCPMPDHPERSLLPLNSFKFHQSSISSRSNPNEGFPVLLDPVGNFVDESFVRQGIRKSSLPNSITAPVLWGREPTGTVANKFGSSSIYESWFEDKVESGSSNLLTDSFTANQSEPLGTFRSVAETDASRNNNNRTRTTTTTTVDASLARDPKSSPQQDTYEPIRMESESDSYSNKNTKEKKFQLFKRFRRLFTRNPFKHASSSSALNAVSRPHKDGSLAETSGGSLTHNSDLIGSPYLKSQKKSNSNLDDGFKKHFSFFSRHRGSGQKVDLIATAPTTPNIYYDNQAAVATIASTSSASMFNFPVKPNAEDMAFHRLPFGGPGLTKGSSNVDLGQDSCRSGVQLLPRGQRRGGFFAFIDDDDDDGASQVESSVANVVCYRKIAFPKRVSDHGARPDNPFLTPSYYRFSKLSSDGEQFSNNNSNNNSSDPDNNSNNNNNNNNNNSNNNRSSSSYEPNSCDDDDDGVSNHDDDDDVASDDYVVIKMTDANASDLELELNKKVIEVSSSSSSSPSSSSSSPSSFVKNVSMDSDHQDRHDGDDNDAGDDDAEKTIGESLVPARDADHQTYVLRKRSRFSGFISRGKQLMNRKPTKRERCVMQ